MGIISSMAKNKWIVLAIGIGMIATAYYVYAKPSESELDSAMVVNIKVIDANGNTFSGDIDINQDVGLLSAFQSPKRVELKPLATYTANVGDLDKTNTTYYFIKPTITVNIKPTDKVPAGEHEGTIKWEANGTTGDGMTLSTGGQMQSPTFRGVLPYTVTTLTVGEDITIPPFIYPKAKSDSTGQIGVIHGSDIGGTIMHFNVSASIKNPSGRVFRGSTTFSIELIDTGNSLEIEVTNVQVKV